MKILLLKSGTLGDIVLLFPILNSLKEKGIQTTLMIRREFIPLITSLNLASLTLALDTPETLFLYLDHQFPSSWRRFFRAQDWVISFSLGKAEERLSAILGEKLVKISLKERGDSHVLDFYTRTFNKILNGLSPVFPDLWKKGDYLIIHPGSGSKHKRWPKEYFQELCKILSFPIKILLGEAEMNEKNEWEKLGEVIFHPPYPELIDLLVNSRLYLGNDSGVTHLSAFLGVPTLAIFGPTSPFHWGPRGKRVRIIYSNFPCSPCKNYCETRECLFSLRPEKIAKEVKILWEVKNEKSY